MPPQTEGWFSWLHHVTDTPPPKLPGTWPVYGQGRDVTWMGNPDDADYRSPIPQRPPRHTY